MVALHRLGDMADDWSNFLCQMGHISI